MANGRGVAAIAAVMLFAAAHGNHHHGHGFASLLSSASRLIPSGGSYTPHPGGRF